MEDWKTKSNKMTMELNELKAQYKELENRVSSCWGHSSKNWSELNRWIRLRTPRRRMPALQLRRKIWRGSRSDSMQSLTNSPPKTGSCSWARSQLPAVDRNLKSSLLEAERYREEYREVAEILALLKVYKIHIWTKDKWFFWCFLDTSSNQKH